MLQIPIIPGPGGLNKPSQPLPEDALRIECDGEVYTIYQPGDDLPAEGEEG
jgi:hypothetical protein